ncbi:putative ABC transport system permease protein [Nitrosomonas aestuarii]|uniref:Putative ABC transport system permease protein n=1 Tax=Nitrosomonas aestuarii TaxID=52441 RepID=A0A1I4BM82_9PROT|nr:ABC transporter permease DevC [Nitrosomonas aestuarii]SFK69089.1 putative ABC transport system permease protein [Nitrosomonas aestuarii]
MKFINAWYFPARLAWRQLIHDKPKLTAAISGVLFACVLVFMQLGFKDSLYASAASMPLKLNGDLFLIHQQSEAMWRPTQFKRSELMRALGHPAVVEVAPLYLSLTTFKAMDTQVKRTLIVYGYDPDTDLLDIEAIRKMKHALRIKDNVMFDEYSRPEFGPVRQMLETGQNRTEVNDYKVTIVGIFQLGISFAADGNIVTSDLNFLRIFPNRSANDIDIGVIRLHPDAPIAQVKKELREQLNDFVRIYTYEEILEHERLYWENTAPIGFIFNFGTVMGLIVGMVIVYQILFTEITNYRFEFATLKAMGYQHGYFVRMVFASALILAVLGFVPGYLLSNSLYYLAESQIFIPMLMTPDKIITVFVFILFMCTVAGFLAIHRLKSANPADMF